MSLFTWPSLGTITAVAIPLSGVIGFYMGFRKWGLEVRKLKLEVKEKEQSLRKQEYELQGQTSARIIVIMAESEKVRQGTNNLIFSEEMLLAFLGKGSYAHMVGEAIDILIAKHRARKAEIPGHWYID